jgi:hypothetical protein
MPTHSKSHWSDLDIALAVTQCMPNDQFWYWELIRSSSVPIYGSCFVRGTSDDATFLSKVIIGDQSWLYDDPETKQPSSHWKNSNLPRTREAKSKVKTMLITSFDIKTVFQKECLPAGQTVSSAHYCYVLWWVHKNLQRLRPKLWLQKNRLSQHDNAPSHTSSSPGNFWRITQLSCPTHPNSLIWPLWFFCSPPPQLTLKLKGHHFGTNEVSEAESLPVPNTVTENDLGTARMCRRVLLWGRWVVSRPKVSFWPDGSTSPVNYGYRFIWPSDIVLNSVANYRPWWHEIKEATAIPGQTFIKFN